MKGVFERFNLPVGGKVEKGEAKISTYEFSKKKDPLFNARAIMNGGMEYMDDGKYVRLHVGGVLMMSDTRMEKRSNFEFCHCANGRVLIAGLGIGLILHNITHRINEGIITSVVIVEKSQDVIDLIKPYFDDISTKVEFVCCDIFEYKPDGKFDTIYFDIWPDICEDNLDQIKKLHNKFKYKLNRHNPNCWMNSWMKDYLQSQKRRNRSRYY